MKHAVATLMRAPGITVREAMILAKFTDDEANTKSMQRKVARSMPMKSKKASVKAADATNASGSKSSADANVPISNITTDGSNCAGWVSSVTGFDDDDANNDELLNWKPPRHRSNAKQMQEERCAMLRTKGIYSRALKFGTTLLASENAKENGMSSRQVAAIGKKRYKGIGPSHATLLHYVANGLIGVSPLKTGPQGDIPPHEYQALCAAFASFMRIQQLNKCQGTNKRGKMAPIIAETMYIDLNSARALLKRLARDTAIDMSCGKLNFAEERRVRWTTYSNLQLWFGTWEKQLTLFGLMEKDERGKPFIPPDNMRRVLNFDETCLSTDGSSINRGGRPAAYWFDPRLPQVGLETVKSAYSCTMITGSTAFGEALPPHFQFATSAKTDEGKRLQVDSIRWMKNVVGEFGLGKRTSLPATIGMNEKGGMDMEEFAEYIRNAIMPLYPDAEPSFGKWVILKCDSGPGRMNIDLLADLRASGFILYPGVPNTTAVTQETDQNYGPFKTQYCKNLDAVVDERIRQGKTTNINMSQVGLIVYGGVDPETNLVVQSAFEAGFSRNACVHAWEKVGAAPPTRACLENKKVLKSLGDGNESYQALLLGIQMSNDIATHTLTSAGYKGSALMATINEYPKTNQITEEHDKDRLDLMARASTSGKMFSVNLSGHLTCDDVFLVTEKTVREREKKRLTIEKTKRERMMRVEAKAKHVLEMKGIDGNRWNVADFDAVLSWYNHPKRSSFTNKEEKLNGWKELQAKGLKEPAACVPWTDEEERMLLDASKENIELGDTALGRVKRRKMSECKQALRDMSEEEFQDLIAARANRATENECERDGEVGAV